MHVHAAVEHRPAGAADQALVGLLAAAVRGDVLDAGVEIHVLAGARRVQTAQAAFAARLVQVDVDVLPHQAAAGRQCVRLEARIAAHPHPKIADMNRRRPFGEQLDMPQARARRQRGLRQHVDVVGIRAGTQVVLHHQRLAVLAQFDQQAQVRG